MPNVVPPANSKVRISRLVKPRRRHALRVAGISLAVAALLSLLGLLLPNAPTQVLYMLALVAAALASYCLLEALFYLRDEHPIAEIVSISTTETTVVWSQDNASAPPNKPLDRSRAR